MTRLLSSASRSAAGRVYCSDKSAKSVFLVTSRFGNSVGCAAPLCRDGRTPISAIVIGGSQEGVIPIFHRRLMVPLSMTD